MDDTTQISGNAAAEPDRRRRRLLYALPVAAFLALAVALAVALQRDPSLVPSPLVGKPAPATALEPVPGFGPGFTEADFRGRVSLVNIFASWCVSCRDEHPLLMRLAEEEDLPIFGLAYKDAPKDAAAWLADYGNPYSATGLDLNGRAAIDWGVYGVPETFLVGPDGTIVYKKIGPLGVEDIEREILPRVADLRARLDGGGAAAPAKEDGADAAASPLPNLAWLDEPRTLPETAFLVEGGREAHFSDYRGKAIVLNFWATWCPPCREEMPSMERLWQQYRERGFVLVAVSVDGDTGAVAPFVKEHGLTFPVALDPRMDVAAAYGVRALPASFLIDRQGQVVALALGPRTWDGTAARALVEALVR